MANTNEERMKQIIEDKKNKGKENASNNLKPTKKVGHASKAFKNKKQGGIFDK